MFNKAILIGRLGKDPEQRFTPSGLPITTFSLATDYVRRDKEGNSIRETDWHNIVFIGRQAEVAKDYLHKGSLVLVEGRIRTNTWEDSNGVRHYRTEVVGYGLRMLDKKPAVEPQESSEETPPSGSTEDDIPF